MGLDGHRGEERQDLPGNPTEQVGIKMIVPDLVRRMGSTSVMAYYHLDKHYTFLKSLDPAATGGLTYNLPGFVNVQSSGAPFDNAFFSPGPSGSFRHMVFGQGAAADWAYDAPVIYHEMTHGAVDAWGGFHPTLDSLGGVDEPGAVNEGTADALAVSESGRSQWALYTASTGTAGTTQPYLRDLNNRKTCKGDGTAATQAFGASTSGKVWDGTVNGLDGEVHDDGEIWGGFFWELHEGLKSVPACNGTCNAASAIQYKAIQLAGGTSPTLKSYANTTASAAAVLFSTRPNLTAYVQCVLGRHDLAACDRTFPLYADEKKAAWVRLRYGTFQYALQVTGNTTFSVCSARGTPANLWFRGSQKVALVSPTVGGATVVDSSAPPTSGPLATTAKCPAVDTFTITAPSPVTGYLLVDALGAVSPNSDIFIVQASSSGMAARPTATAPVTCTYAGDPPTLLSIVPASGPTAGGTTVTLTGTNFATGVTVTMGGIAASVTGSTSTSISVVTPVHSAGAVDVVVTNPDGLSALSAPLFLFIAPPVIAPTSPVASPKGSIAFTSSGGSGVGYTWSLATNASGGSIAATGGYTAGSTGSVTDVIQVTDSLGGTATSSVTVSAGVLISLGTPSTAPKGSISCGASGGSGVGFTWSLATNNSGGSIDATTGAYTAGPTGNVIDVVQVTDSLGNTATASVTVTALIAATPPAPSSGGGGSKSGGCGTAGGADASFLALGLAVLLRFRRKSAGQVP